MKLLLAKVMPKEQDAAAFNCSAFAGPAVRLDRIDDMEKELLFKKERVDREPVVPGSFHTDFKVVGAGRIRSEFGKEGMSAVRGIGKGKSLKYHLSRFIHHGSDMVIFTDINANKNIKPPQKKNFRLGDHSSNTRHYLVRILIR